MSASGPSTPAPLQPPWASSSRATTGFTAVCHTTAWEPSRLIDQPTRDKIAKGRIVIEGKVDLHGLTQSEAYSMLLGFLHQAHARHKRHVLVVTGKFPDNARLHLDHVGFDVDHLEGWVWGVGKADVLRREGATIYVGDHVHDVEGARAAGAVSVSVLTGGCTRPELVEAGTDVVLDELDEFPAWLDAHDRGQDEVTVTPRWGVTDGAADPAAS